MSALWFSCRYDNGNETGTGYVGSRYVNLKIIAHSLRSCKPSVNSPFGSSGSPYNRVDVRRKWGEIARPFGFISCRWDKGRTNRARTSSPGSRLPSPRFQVFPLPSPGSPLSEVRRKTFDGRGYECPFVLLAVTKMAKDPARVTRKRFLSNSSSW